MICVILVELIQCELIYGLFCSLTCDSLVLVFLLFEFRTVGYFCHPTEL